VKFEESKKLCATMMFHVIKSMRLEAKQAKADADPVKVGSLAHLPPVFARFTYCP
jgi:hypothetical protein